MSYQSVTHVAIEVASLREAEDFYRTLFALDVAFREAEVADGWRTLPANAGWEEAEAAGIELGLSVLSRDAFTLALEAESVSAPVTGLSHIGLEVDEGELDRLRTEATRLGCQLALDRPGIIVIHDPYGFRWEVTTSHEMTSTGSSTGRWLNVRGTRRSQRP